MSTATIETVRRPRKGRISPSSVHQRQPSLWMLVAIGQAMFWLFGIPALCRKQVWDKVFGRIVANYGESTAEFVLIISVAPLFFFLYTLVMIPIYAGDYPFFEQYKIQEKGWPWFDSDPKVRQHFWKLSFKSLRLTAFNLFLLVPILVGAKIHFENDILQKDRAFFFSTSDDHWPSTQKNIQDILLMTMLQEFGFYATHRMMHAHPYLYQFHKVHHEYKMNTTLAAQHNHPVDYVVSLSGPAVLAIALVPSSHSISQFQFALWLLWANLDDHVGYAFPWSPLRWFPGSALTDEHEFHHSQNKGCFGTKLSWSNHLLGGYEHYEKYYAGGKEH